MAALREIHHGDRKSPAAASGRARQEHDSEGRPGAIEEKTGYEKIVAMRIRKPIATVLAAVSVTALSEASQAASYPSPPYPTCTFTLAQQTTSAKGPGAYGDACVMYWLFTADWLTRESFEKACNGIKPYPDPQPPGIPATLAECEHDIPVIHQVPMTEAQKNAYRATWKTDGPQNFR